jgi:hypothetical protein
VLLGKEAAAALQAAERIEWLHSVAVISGCRYSCATGASAIVANAACARSLSGVQIFAEKCLTTLPAEPTEGHLSVSSENPESTQYSKLIKSLRARRSHSDLRFALTVSHLVVHLSGLR